MKNKTILIIGAHPDDETYGMGGTIAKYSEHNSIHLLILSDGNTSRNESKYLTSDKNDMLKQIKNLYKLKSVHNCMLKDQRFDSYDILDIIQIIEGHVKKIDPSIVYTHNISDINKDHRITSEATMVACRPVTNVQDIYMYESCSSTEWNFNCFDPIFFPNLYEKLKDTHIEAKCQACNIYDVELEVFPHPRSIKGVKIRSSNRGMEINSASPCEVFKIIKMER